VSGSNHHHHKILMIAEDIEDHSKDNPQRMAFVALLRKCAIAAQAIEWVAAGDHGPGADVEPINEALGFTWHGIVPGRTIRLTDTDEPRDDLHLVVQSVDKADVVAVCPKDQTTYHLLVHVLEETIAVDREGHRYQVALP
jgi:hypothetical protein